MANISKANLQDKDIRSLATPKARKKIAVGNPKELYLWLHPTGKKIFFIKLPNEKTCSLGEFREGIYSVSEARKEAQKVLKELSSGKDLEIIRGKSDKYKFKNLFLTYLDGKIAKGLKANYTDKIKGHFTHYVLPKTGEMDAKDIKYSTLRDILIPIFNPNNPSQSRLRTIHEIITHLHSIFSIAIKDDYIGKDPSFGLSDEFLTARKFAQKNNISTNMPLTTIS